MIRLDKRSASYDVLLPKICVPEKQKTFTMIANKNEAKAMTKHIVNVKCKFSSTTCHSNQKWNNETCQRECKNYQTCKKDYSWTPSACTCENRKYLKSIADTSVIACDEIISVMDIVATKMPNTIVFY